MRAALLAAVVFGTLLGLLSRGAGAADRPAILLYASDWLGPMRILAADPTGTRPVGQLTFQPVEDGICGLPWACGTDEPTPSPDGHVVAYTTPAELWLARADGSKPTEALPMRRARAFA